MIKAMVVDDEPLALEFAAQLIEQHKDIDVIGSFTDSLKCIEAVKKKAPHIAFLDVHMPEISGLELAERLLEINPNIYIVFLTAYDVFAVEAFELDTLDYIIKPIKEERLEKTITRYLKHATENDIQLDEDNNTYLELKVSEYLSFQSDEEKVQTIPWRTAKAQELFIYLLQNNGQYVEKEKLMELLWEDKDLESSASLVYTNIYNVRKALKQFGDHFRLKNQLDGYILELNHVRIDVLDWEAKTLALQPISKDNIVQYERQINLFQGQYLIRHDYVWLEQKRQSLMKLWQQCVGSVVQYCTKQGEWKRAVDLLEDISEKYPGDEGIHFALMKIYGDMGDLDAIAAQYRKLIKGLRAELDISPSTEVQNWYKENVIKKLTLDIKE